MRVRGKGKGDGDGKACDGRWHGLVTRSSVLDDKRLF